MARPLRGSVGLLLVLGCGGLPLLIPDPLKVRVGRIQTEHLEQSLARLPRSLPQRTEFMVQAFRDAGCPDAELWRTPGTRGADSIFCSLPGRSPQTVIVAGNLDRAADGRGVVDNGSSMALLPLLYTSLRVEPRHHSFLFAAFTDTLFSQHGSRRYLRRLDTESRSRIRAMVQLKALGVGTPAMWGERADPNLRQDLFSVSRALEIRLRNAPFYSHVAVDARSFGWWGIPTITIHSLNRRTARLLAEPYRDRDLRHIDWGRFGATARMLAIYLGYLDETLQRRVDLQQPAPEAL